MDAPQPLRPQTPVEQQGHLSKTQLYTVTVILSIAVLGLAGYIVWDSFLTDSANPTPNQITIENEDTVENEEENEELESGERDETNIQSESIDTAPWITYYSSFWTGDNIAFKCPPNWKFESNMPAGLSEEYSKCTSPDGSVFKHFLDPKAQDYRYTCDERSDVLIEETDYIRHYDNDSNEWYICSAVTSAPDYTYNPGTEAFMFIAANTSELEYLDEILRSVRSVSELFFTDTATYQGDGSSISSEYAGYSWFKTCSMQLPICTHYLIPTGMALTFDDFSEDNINKEFYISGTATGDSNRGATDGNSYIILKDVEQLQLAP